MIIGKLLFIFFPAIIIMYIEDWNYLDSFYYAFVTVFTIGFGDLVASKVLYILFNIFRVRLGLGLIFGWVRVRVNIWLIMA